MHEFKDRICKIKDRLADGVEMCLRCDIQNLNLEEVKAIGEFVDMIKDLAEAEKYCAEALYYEEKSEELEMMECDDEMYDRRGYNPNRTAKGRYASSGGDRSGGRSMRRGYEPRDVRHPFYPGEGDDMAPYMDGGHQTEMSKYGRPYNEYKMYKRNYTASKSAADKAEMDKRAMEHVEDTIATMKDIWSTSDPELKRKMKIDLNTLLGDMN